MSKEGRGPAPNPAKGEALGTPHIVSIQVGQIVPLGPGRVRSAFVKRPVSGPVQISREGVAGDDQADKTVHGDAAKAVYGYAQASYAIWRETHPHHAPLLVPGGMAENLTIAGMTEEDVCIGDIVAAGTCRLQVTQPREPCFKFALRYADSRMPKAMLHNGRTGWYYRVLTPGRIAPGDPMTLIDRPNPAWSITRMNAVIHARHRPPGETEALLALPGLAETWPPRLRQRA